MPCVTLRTETEWIETVQAGWNKIVASNPDRIAEAVSQADQVRQRPRPDLYGQGDAGDRTVGLLLRVMESGE